jgi:hypothetical protein
MIKFESNWVQRLMHKNGNTIPILSMGINKMYMELKKGQQLENND